MRIIVLFILSLLTLQAVGQTLTDTPREAPRVDYDQYNFSPVAFGTLVKGEITPKANKVVGFQSDIRGNVKATYSFFITEGDALLNIKIINSADNTEVFSTRLGYASSVHTIITFPSSTEYIIYVEEARESRGSRATKFEISSDYLEKVKKKK